MVRINFIVALPAEAKPLIRHFALQRDLSHQKLKVYQAADIRLLITGVGMKAAQSATTSLLLATENSQQAHWINLGIAGHPSAAIGSIYVVEQITHATNQTDYRLNPPSNLPCPTALLTTLEKPDFDYSRDTLLDMEAAGFMHAMSQAVSIEQIQCIKIISDNAQQTGQKITAKFVSSLIENKLDIISQLTGYFHDKNRGKAIAE